MKLARRWFALALFSPLLAAQTAEAVLTPKQLDALRARAYAAENAQRFAEAADSFVTLATAEPQRVDWVVAAGRCLGRSGRFAQALDLLDAGRKRFPGVHDVPVMLARTLVMQAELDRTVLQPDVLLTDAAEITEGVLALDPNHEESRLILAQARYRLGDWQRAVKEAEEAVRRHPTRAGAHILLGRIASDRLRALLQRHGTEQPTGQAAADLVAEIDVQRQLALRSYQAAARLDPTKPHPHVALGQLAWLDNHRDQARGHFADALVVDPEVAIDHDEIHEGQTWQQRAAFYAEALARHTSAPTRVESKAATLRFQEGRAKFDGGQWQDARTVFTEALAANPALTHNHYYLFLASYYAGDHDAAEKHAAAYAAISAPAFADVIRGLVGERRGAFGAILEFLANRAYERRHLDASRDLNHVVACLKDSADAWNNHAFLCRETGQFDAAFASYQHALEKEPDSPQLLNDAAVILQYHLPSPANAQKARGMYERVVQLADQQLTAGRITGPDRERVVKAKADARANLDALDK